MAFRFSLESVLRYRVRRMEAEARKLHAIESAALRLEQENARMAARCRDLARGSRADVSTVGLDERSRLTEFVRSQHRLIKSNEDEIAGIRRRADAQRRILLDAQREVKALELLKDRRSREWKLQQRRLEQKRMDEIASLGSGRRA